MQHNTKGDIRLSNATVFTKDQAHIMGTAILHGYRRSAKGATAVPVVPDVLIVGTTEASARSFCLAILQETPPNFKFIGADTHYNDVCNSKVAHAVFMLADLAFISDASMDQVTRCVWAMLSNSRNVHLLFSDIRVLDMYYDTLYNNWLNEHAPFNVYYEGRDARPGVNPMVITREVAGRYLRIPFKSYRTWPEIIGVEDVIFRDDLLCYSGYTLSLLMYTFQNNYNMRRWVTPAVAKKVFEYRAWLAKAHSLEGSEACDTSDHEGLERLVVNEDGSTGIIDTISDEVVLYTRYDDNGNDLLRNHVQPKKKAR